MAVIGSATLNIVPKVQGGLANAINGEVKKANLGSLGKSAGSSFMGGLSSGAAIGAWSAITQRAIGAVTSSLGSAASRVDTLANYPKVMTSLMGGTEEAASAAQRSIDVLSKSLDNVPTRLDDMANTVQGIYAASMKYGTSLDTVTDAGLALNSMLLSGGQSQQIVNSAMEQFRQMVAKGKPDLQDWRALISAAPGQMEMLAKSMLDANATATDLYAALGGGKKEDYEGPYKWGSIGMGEFIERFAAMREQFEGTAEEAQHGIGTAFANMQNAVTKGVANVLNAFGQERISSAIGDIKGAINSIFGRDDTQGLRAFAVEIAPMVSDAWDTMVEKVGDFSDRVAPSIGQISKTFLGIAKDVAPSLNTMFDTLLDSAAELAPTIADLTGDVAGVVGDTIKGIADIVTDVAPTITSIAKDVLPIVGNIVEAIGPALPAIITAKAALGGFGTVAGMLTSAGDGALAFAGGLKNLGGAAGPFLKTALPLIKSVGDIGPAFSLAAEATGTTVASLVPMGAVAGVAAAGVGLLGVGLYKAWQEEHHLKQRSEDLTGAIGDMQSNTEGLSKALRYGSDDVDVFGKKFKNAKPDIDGLVESMQRHADRNAETRQSTSDMIDELERYQSVIDRAAGAGDNYKGSMAELKDAVSGINDILGTSYDVHDVLKGKYKDEAGEVHNLREEIDQLIAAKKREAYTDAVQEMYSDTLKEQLKAQKQLTKAQDEYNNGHKRFMDDNKDTVNALTGVKYTQEELERAWQNSEWGKKASQDLQDASRACNALNDELKTYDQMMDEANGWGEREGIINTTTQMKQAVDDMGISAKQLAEGLESAGVSTEQFAQIGGEQFALMAQMAGGDMDTLIGLIQNYNAQEFQSKYSELHVDGYGNVVDAQGTIYEWNGTEMVPKYATVDATDAVAGAGEAQAAIDEVQSPPLITLTANVTGQNLVNELDTSIKGVPASTNPKVAAHVSGTGGVEGLNRAINSLPGEKHTYVYNHEITVKEIRHVESGKSGGSATGAHIEPRHASGYIAAGPTHTSFGLVGEDGIEAVYNNDNGTSDVYPLNNPRYIGYADPLAERIADALANKGGYGGDVNMYIDGAKVNDDAEIRAVVLNLFDILQRKGAMNRG